MSTNLINKEDLNLIRKNLQELLKDISSPERDYNPLKEKISALDIKLNPLIQHFSYLEEDNTITLLVINLGGIRTLLTKLEKYIKPTEIKTEKYNFKILPSFFNNPSTTKKTQYPDELIILLKSSLNLLEQWLENKGWLEKDEDQLKPRFTHPSHNVQ